MSESETTVVDNRPLIEPDCFSWRELREDSDARQFMEEMRETWGETVEWARLTIVSDEYPNPPYENGFYFEGWSKAPWNCDPPGKEAPFDFPLTPHPRSAPDG